MIEPEISTIKPKPADKSKIWKIWKVAIILGLVTAAEFYVALHEIVSFLFYPLLDKIMAELFGKEKINFP